MGCDHAIIVGFGYRIPINMWNEFKNSLQQRQLKSKKVKIYRSTKQMKQTTLIGDIISDEGEDSSYDDTFIDADWEIDAIEGHSERPTTHGFATQDNCLKEEEEGYVFIYSIHAPYEYLIDRKIGGAMSWICSRFEHMQNVSTLNFSIKLQHDHEDWKLDSGEWHEETQQRKDLLARVPEFLKDFLETLSVQEHYNQWLFSYAC
jgi:hypothetical protein